MENKIDSELFSLEGKIKEIDNGLKTAYVDSQWNSNLAYRPEFLSNDYKRGRKVLSSIEEELKKCDEFCISVAFITMSGITPLLQIFKELEEKNIPGKILTTDYLTFSDPKALEKLHSLKNIQLKMFCSTPEVGGFHTKGYIFRDKEIYRIIIGSSNMTINAITKNKEWNTKIISTENGEFAKNILDEFDSLWKGENSLEYDQFIDEYSIKYKSIKKQREIAKNQKITSIEQYKLEPNKMQVAFINNLKKMQLEGENRVLLISATGTGKTFASAFALREMNPKKILFIVHREQIAKQAKKSYEMVFGTEKLFGILSGNTKEIKADFLFSTMQMMSKESIYNQFKNDEFDVIVIDEVHRAGSYSYQKIIDYFKPKFFLGMTASPERTDGFDIYSLFDHNIAYEIRLQQALEEDLLCPFHYFGITDLLVDGKSIGDDSKNFSSFNLLTNDTRVDYIIQKANYYGYSGNRVRGLIFCSGKDEAKELSIKFNKRGYNTDFLCGDDSQNRREECIDRLTSDQREDKLDYIFTVDIFNEGVDVPEINQIIMLRPTESPIVFVQQLGRGLRKAEGKEYVVILDFIGNYKNNFMIPIALSGDRTYNQDTIRKYVISGNNVIPGASTIHFDSIAKEKIFASIDQMKGIKGIIRESYAELKNKLGRVPYLLDFYESGEIDPLVIVREYKTYQNFLQNVEKKDNIEKLNEQEIITLEYLSKTVLSGIRPNELFILKKLLEDINIEKNDIKKEIREQYGYIIDDTSIESSLQVLRGHFVSKESEYQKYKQIEILEEISDGKIQRMASFSLRLKHDVFKKQIMDIIHIGLCRYKEKYNIKSNKESNFVLYEKYSRRDVSLLMNCEKDLSSTMYGMKRINDDVFIFVTYHKVESSDIDKEYVDGKPDYADKFENNLIFTWDSQIGKGLDSSYMKDVFQAKNKHLFVKKSDAESNFYYMGKFDIIDAREDKKRDNSGKERTITKVKMKMYHGVREDLLNYLESEIIKFD